MGYSLSMEQYEKLERNRRENRLCAESTGKGGCFNRATVSQTHRCWPYKVGEAYGSCPVEGQESTMTFCGRHARTMPVGYEGVNFTVIAEHRL